MSNTTFLTADPTAARLARDAVRRFCDDTDVAAADADTAVLLTSELVANAIRHTGEPSVLTAVRRPGRLRVSVADHSTEPPRLHPPASPTSDSGRGLLLVSQLAQRWGHTPSRTGKTVWFELTLA